MLYVYTYIILCISDVVYPKTKENETRQRNEKKTEKKDINQVTKQFNLDVNKSHFGQVSSFLRHINTKSRARKRQPGALSHVLFGLTQVNFYLANSLHITNK